MATILSASAIPFGYTIAIWSSGALLIRSHGDPTVGDVFLFLAGALFGFTVLGLLGRGVMATAEPINHSEARVLAGVLDWIAVGTGVGAAALIAEIHGWLAWPLVSFAATCIYLTGAGVQLALVAIRREGKHGSDRPRPTSSRSYAANLMAQEQSGGASGSASPRSGLRWPG